MPHRPQARIVKQKLQLPIMRRCVLYEVGWKHWVLFSMRLRRASHHRVQVIWT